TREKLDCDKAQCLIDCKPKQPAIQTQLPDFSRYQRRFKAGRVEGDWRQSGQCNWYDQRNGIVIAKYFGRLQLRVFGMMSRVLQPGLGKDSKGKSSGPRVGDVFSGH